MNIIGLSGSGKSVLLYNIARESLLKNQKIMFISFNQEPHFLKELLSNISSKKLDDIENNLILSNISSKKLDDIENNLIIVDAYSQTVGMESKEKYSINSRDLSDISIGVSKALENKPSIAFFDPLSSIAIHHDEQSLIKTIQIIISKLRGNVNCSYFTFQSGIHSESFYQTINSLADINLEQKLLDDKIECLIKLKDDSAMIECRDYYEEIFNIEMELREILFIILLDSFSSINWYNLLDEYKSELIPNESKKSKDKDIYFQKRRVNELFFLTFSQYKQLGNNDKLKTINVIDMINRHNIYNNLRHAINNRGITKTKYQDFFAKIKENLDSIEEVRNDIAHSRFIFKDNIINYSTAKEKLKTAIVDFWG